MASWWCAIHGYRHPALDAAARDQLDRMAHVMFGGLTHEPAVRLARAAGGADARAAASTCSSATPGSVVGRGGAEARACRRGPAGARMLTVRGGYHGDTFGAMAVCDPVGGMHALFAGALPEHVFADRPPRVLDERLRRAAASAGRAPRRRARRRHRRAGRPGRGRDVVLRPGGACALLRELCDRHGLLLVLDEIATGFGRTGDAVRLRARRRRPRHPVRGQGADRRLPDAGGDAVHDATWRPSLDGGALMHGPTYMANPLACAVALASTGLLAERRVARRGAAHRARPARRPGAGARAARASPTSACSARSA